MIDRQKSPWKIRFKRWWVNAWAVRHTRYLYYSFKRAKLSQYFLFHWPTAIVICVLFMAGLIWLYPYDYEIVLPEMKGQVFILETLVKTLTLFFGIMFSFTILSFNFFFRYFGRYVFLDFFRNRSIRFFFTLFIVTLLLLVYSSWFIDQSTSINNYTRFLFVFSVICSLGVFIAFFPCVVILLKSSQSRQHIKKLVSRLNEDWVMDELIARIKDNKLEFYHKDPISILTEIGSAATKEFDNRTVHVIADELVAFFKQNIQHTIDGKSRVSNNTLYHEFSRLFFRLFQLAVKERNANAAMLLCRRRFDLEIAVLENHTTKAFEWQGTGYNVSDFVYVYSQFISRAIQFNEDEVTAEIIDLCRDALTRSLTSIFPRDFVYKDRFSALTDKRINFLFHSLQTLTDIGQLVVASEKVQLFKNISNLFYTVCHTVLDMQIDACSKCYLLSVISNYAKDQFQLYAESSKVTRITSLYFPLTNSHYYFQKADCQHPFLAALDAMDFLYAKDKLNLVVINNLRADMTGIIRDLDTRKNADVLLLQGVKRFLALAQKVAAGDSDIRKEVYLHLYEGLEELSGRSDWHEVKNTTVRTSLLEIMKGFTNYDTYSEELKGKGHMKDDRIS